MRDKALSCVQVRDLLEEHFEQTLPERREREVAAHLRQCQACAAELEQIHRISAALAAAPLPVAAPELLQAIAARTAALPAPRASAKGWLRLGLLAGACVAALAALRLAAPLAAAHGVVLLMAVVAWVKAAAVSAAPWAAPAADVARGMLAAAEGIAHGLRLAAVAAAPAAGLYVAAEIGFIAVVLLALRWGRGKAQVRLSGMVV